MMNESQITVGELSSFLLYAAFVGASIGGQKSNMYRLRFFAVQSLMCCI